MDATELINSGIPSNYEIKTFGKDHFFTAIAEALNNVRQKLQLNPKQLRGKCKTFINEQIKNTSQKPRIINILSNRNQYNTILEYCLNIVCCAEECEAYGVEIPILGQPDIEGRFISELFNLDIHLIECVSKEEFKHRIIKKDGAKEVQSRDISYTNTNLIHIIKINVEEYGAVILNKTSQNNQIGKLSVVDKKRGGTIDSGRVYEEGISAHIAIQCSLNKNVENFELLNNMDGLGAFDDVVLKIKYEDGKESELYAFQLKHKENNKVTLSNIFENKNEMFYLPKYEESFNQICELYRNNPNSIFEDVKLENIKFILFSNIRFENKEKITTNKYVFTKDFCMKTFSTKDEVFPYRISHKNPSQKNEVTTEFLSKCWIYPNQINANEIEELIKNNLENNIRPDKIKIVLNCFATWTRRKGNEKIVKSDMNNLIIETCLPHYDIFTSHNLDSDSNVILKSLNENCYFPFIEKSNLEILKMSILQEIENNFAIKISLDLLHEKISKPVRDKLKINPKYKSFLKTKEMFSQNVRYSDLFYILWQVRELPMLVEFTNESRKSIEFILNRFPNYVQTKSFILVYKGIVSTIRRIEELNKIINWDMLDKIFISFHEKNPVDLKTLTNTDKMILKTITPNILIKLLRRIERIGKKFDLLPFYIHRKIKIPLLKKTILNEHNDLFISNNKKYINIEEYLEEYKQYLQRKLNPYQKHVIFKCEDVNMLYSNLPANESICKLNFVNEKFKHVVIKEDNGENFYLVKTNRAVDSLRKYLTTVMVKEENLSKFAKNPVNIVCNTAGMGKTCLLQSLANNFDPAEWTIYLDLNEHVHQLDSFNYSEDKEVVEYLVENQTTDKDLKNFIKQLLLKRSKDGYVTLLLDGYDEVIFRKIKEFAAWTTKKGMKVWITTRPSKIAELETSLGIFSMEMQHFDQHDQAEFLKSFYKQKNVKNIIEKVQTFDGAFIGIPLQTKLLAEVLLDVPTEELEEVTIDLVYLYEQFLNKKIEELGEHKRDVYKQFCMKLSLSLFFTQQILDSYLDFTDLNGKIKEFKVEFKKDFLISSFTKENVPMFVHRTYAEFLAAQYLHQQLTDNNLEKRKPWKILQEKLFEIEMTDVRYFLDRIAAKSFKLHKAVLNNDLNLVTELLELSQEKDELGRTALELACSYGKRFDFNAEIKFGQWDYDKIDLENLEKRNYGEWNTFSWNKWVGNKINILVTEQKFTVDENIIQKLLQNKITTTKTNFVSVIKAVFTNNSTNSESNFAFKTGSLQILEQFSKLDQVNQLPRSKKELLLYYCSIHNFHNIVNKLSIEKQSLNKLYNQKLLTHIAAENGNFEVCRVLHKKGAKIINNFKNTLLHTAAKNGQAEFIAKLLTRNKKINEKNCDNKTALYYAVKEGHLDVINLLLKMGTKLKREGEHVLHLASSLGNLEVVECLINFDANCVNVQDYDGKTPLHYAVEKCNLTTTIFLISKGADFNKTDNFGNTILHTIVQEIYYGNNPVPVVEKILKLNYKLKYVQDKNGQTPLQLLKKNKQHYYNYYCNIYTRENYYDVLERMLS